MNYYQKDATANEPMHQQPTPKPDSNPPSTTTTACNTKNPAHNHENPSLRPLAHTNQSASSDCSSHRHINSALPSSLKGLASAISQPPDHNNAVQKRESPIPYPPAYSKTSTDISKYLLSAILHCTAPLRQRLNNENTPSTLLSPWKSVSTHYLEY